MHGPYHIVIRLGTAVLDDPTEAPQSGEPFWDDIKHKLQIATGADTVVSFAPVNDHGGIAPGFDTYDNNFSLKAAYKIGGPWGTRQAPAYTNHNAPTYGFYFPKDVSNNPLGVAVTVDEEDTVIYGHDDIDHKKKIIGRAGSKVYGVSEADDFVLAAINKALDDNADIISAFVYETRLDADKGSWRDRITSASWRHEASSPTRGVKRKFPSTALVIARSDKVQIYDADDVNLALWMTFTYGPDRWLRDEPTAVSARNGVIMAASATGLMLFDLPNDEGYFFTEQFRFRYSTPVSQRNDSAQAVNIGSINSQGAVGSALFGDVAKIAAGISSASFVDPTSGINRNYIAAIGETNGYVITPSRTVLLVGQDNAFTDVACSPYGDIFMAGEAAIKAFRPQTLFGSSASEFLDEDGFIAPLYEYSNRAASVHKLSLPVYSNGSHPVLVAAHNSMIAAAWKNSSSQLVLARVLENKVDPDRGMVSLQSEDWSSGWMIGDCKGAWLANSKTLDRSGRNTSLTQNGTVPEALVSKTKAYGPFSESNYLSASYGANTISLPATGWCIPFWAKIPATTTNQVLFEIASADSNEDYLRVEIDEVDSAADPDTPPVARSALIVTHRSNGNVITMKSFHAVDINQWSLFAIVKRGNRLMVSYNGVYFMAYTFTPTLAANYRGVQNAACSLYVGRGVRTPAAPFAGQIALLRWCWTPPTDNQLEALMDWERQFFTNTGTGDEFHFGATPEEIRAIDIDPITGTLALATDHGVYQYDRFRMTANYLPSNSNIPSLDVNDVSLQAGNMVCGTADGTWVAFPPISMREKVSTVLDAMTPNENYFVTNAGGSYQEYNSGSNTVTETLVAVIEVPPGGTGTIDTDITVQPVDDDPVPLDPHVCNGTYNVQPSTTVPPTDVTTLTGADWAAYVNYHPDLLAEWSRPVIQALSMFRTNGMPDIRKYGFWHYGYHTINPQPGKTAENRYVPPWPAVTVTPVEHNCVGDDSVNIRIEPIAGTGNLGIWVEHPADQIFRVDVGVIENYLGGSGVGGGRHTMLDYRTDID